MDKKQLQRIRTAYDATVTDLFNDIDPWENVPEEFLESPEFKAFEKDADPALTGSTAPDIREFLSPQPGMKLLDAGCCANLAAKGFGNWPSLYYGVDISPELIRAMQAYADKERLQIGSLAVTEMADLPFPDDFFDIAMVIGVFEYVDLEYSERSFRELRRVLKPGAKMVIDIPNLDHPLVNVMFTLEDYLGRPHIIKSHKVFEEALAPFFLITKINSAHSMRKYFVHSNTERRSFVA